MKTVALDKQTNILVNKWSHKLGMCLLTRSLTPVYSDTQIDLAYKLENEERAAKRAARLEHEMQVAREEAEYRNTPEFREEVIAEIMATGATRLQAEGRTRDQARLLAEAATFNLM